MPPTTTNRGGEFERQRGELLKEIAESFELVLANINKLNRNLEAVITVGNEFSSVEALWSTFENVMGKGEGEAAEETAGNENENAGTGAGKTETNRSGDREDEAGEGQEES